MDQRLQRKTRNINLLEENTGLVNKLLDIDLADGFFGSDTKIRGNKTKNKQVGLHQTKSFRKAKEIINKIKRQLTDMCKSCD